MRTGKCCDRYEVIVFCALAVLVVTLTGLLLNVGLQGQVFA